MGSKGTRSRGRDRGGNRKREEWGVRRGVGGRGEQGAGRVMRRETTEGGSGGEVRARGSEEGT